MADLTNIGRPYARAAFQHAREKSQLSEWKAFLANATEVANNPTVAKLLEDLTFSSTDLLKLFEGVLEKIINAEQKNFLTLLAQNRRLNILPEINTLFNDYCTQLDKMADVRMVTAVAVDDSFKQKISRALTKRIQREVTLECEIDPAIIGGAIIHFGDRVIDGSVRGKLTRLLEFSLR